MYRYIYNIQVIFFIGIKISIHNMCSHCVSSYMYFIEYMQRTHFIENIQSSYNILVVLRFK